VLLLRRSDLAGGKLLQAAHARGFARLNADGTLDTQFNPGVAGDPFATVFAIAVQSDGRIVVGGSFNSINGAARTNLARLNAGGILDTNFNPGAIVGGQLSSAVYAVAVDGLGKVLVGGDFTSVNGSAHTNLARLNTNGTLDTSFNPAAGTDYAVNSIVVQTDGKVLLGGFFTQVNGRGRNCIARLNADGTLDTGFDPGSGADAVIYSVALQADGKVLIGGGFTSFNGTPRGGIARLQNTITVPAPQLVNPVLSNGVFKVSLATVGGRSYFLEFKDALTGSTWTGLPAVQGDGTLKTLIDPSATGPRRFYRVRIE